MNNAFVISVPGRLNLIGEHIDYHNLPVLPIAIQRRIRIAFQPRLDRRIHAVSTLSSDAIDLSLDSAFQSGPSGHWGNYVRAAAQAIQSQRDLTRGIDAQVTSDLPSAAGLSSSSALLIAFSLALLQANGLEMPFDELTDILPDGEQLVGTRGGAMDHVAILASRADFATLIKSFAPLEIEFVSVPANWRFLVAHSLVTAEKSGVMREEYNFRRIAGTRALEAYGFASFREALAPGSRKRSAVLHDFQWGAFAHVTSEARRVLDATTALRHSDLDGFGRLLCESHASLRDNLRVSLPAIDQLVDSALQAGAHGARLTGAGFGGCVVCLCTAENVERVRGRLVQTYYAGRPGFDPTQHLFVAEPSSGAL